MISILLINKADITITSGRIKSFPEIYAFNLNFKLTHNLCGRKTSSSQNIATILIFVWAITRLEYMRLNNTGELTGKHARLTYTW